MRSLLLSTQNRFIPTQNRFYLLRTNRARGDIVRKNVTKSECRLKQTIKWNEMTADFICVLWLRFYTVPQMLDREKCVT